MKGVGKRGIGAGRLKVSFFLDLGYLEIGDW